MCTKRIFLAFLTLLGLEAAAAAQYQPPPPNPYPPPPPPQQPYGQPYGQPPPPPSVYGYGLAPGAHQHDGFYLRLNLGFGGTSGSLSDYDLKVSGASGIAEIAIGGVVAENLIIFGEAFAHVITGPTVTLNGDSAQYDTDTSAGAEALGAGLAYYFMPANVYIAGSVDAFRLFVQHNGEDVAHTDAGVGLHLMVGKEWWVSDGWGLGVALELFGGRVKDTTDSYGSWTAGTLGLTFSATYN